MTSMVTNIGAINALATFRQLNADMAENQMQISTGKKINEAKDDAYLWVKAQKIGTDISSLNSAHGSITQSKGILSVTQEGVKQVIEVLKKMNDLIGHASNAEDTEQRSMIQSQITSYVSQINSAVKSANFNGRNLLTGGEALSVMSSFERTGNGVRVNSDMVNTVNFLADNLTRTYPGNPVSSFVINNQEKEVSGGGNSWESGARNWGANGKKIELELNNLDATDYRAGDKFTFKLGSETAEYEVQAEDLTESNFADHILQKIGDAIIAVVGDKVQETSGTAAVTDGKLTLTTKADGTSNIGSTKMSVTFTDQMSSEPGALSNLTTIDVTRDPGEDQEGGTSAAEAMFNGFRSIIMQKMDEVNSAAARFGYFQDRVETQANYLKSITENLEKGISNIVDADMEKVSTDMQSLKIRQQLAVQALSVANQTPMNLLSLFR